MEEVGTGDPRCAPSVRVEDNVRTVVEGRWKERMTLIKKTYYSRGR